MSLGLILMLLNFEFCSICLMRACEKPTNNNAKGQLNAKCGVCVRDSVCELTTIEQCC